MNCLQALCVALQMCVYIDVAEMPPHQRWEGGAELHRASVQAVNCAVTGLWFCVCLAQGVSGDGKVGCCRAA